MNRRQATKKERLTPCECCGHPISQRHHLLQVSFYGENDVTAQLCANCHELLHLAIASNDNRNFDEDAFLSGKKSFGISKAQVLWGSAIRRLGFDSDIIKNISALVRKTEEFERELTKAAIKAAKNEK